MSLWWHVALVADGRWAVLGPSQGGGKRDWEKATCGSLFSGLNCLKYW